MLKYATLVGSLFLLENIAGRIAIDEKDYYENERISKHTSYYDSEVPDSLFEGNYALRAYLAGKNRFTKKEKEKLEAKKKEDEAFWRQSTADLNVAMGELTKVSNTLQGDAFNARSIASLATSAFTIASLIPTPIGSVFAVLAGIVKIFDGFIPLPEDPNSQKLDEISKQLGEIAENVKTVLKKIEDLEALIKEESRSWKFKDIASDLGMAWDFYRKMITSKTYRFKNKFKRLCDKINDYSDKLRRLIVNDDYGHKSSYLYKADPLEFGGEVYNETKYTTFARDVVRLYFQATYFEVICLGDFMKNFSKEQIEYEKKGVMQSANEGFKEISAQMERDAFHRIQPFIRIIEEEAEKDNGALSEYSFGRNMIVKLQTTFPNHSMAFVTMRDDGLWHSHRYDFSPDYQKEPSAAFNISYFSDSFESTFKIPSSLLLFPLYDTSGTPVELRNSFKLDEYKTTSRLNSSRLPAWLKRACAMEYKTRSYTHIWLQKWRRTMIFYFRAMYFMPDVPIAFVTQPKPRREFSWWDLTMNKRFLFDLYDWEATDAIWATQQFQHAFVMCFDRVLQVNAKSCDEFLREFDRCLSYDSFLRTQFQALGCILQGAPSFHTTDEMTCGATNHLRPYWGQMIPKYRSKEQVPEHFKKSVYKLSRSNGFCINSKLHGPSSFYLTLYASAA